MAAKRPIREDGPGAVKADPSPGPPGCAEKGGGADRKGPGAPRAPRPGNALAQKE
jgi:hypothetical protein